MKDRLNIVDEQGNIIGEDTSKNIHELGLLHREVHVWFYTPDGEIIFQRRGKKKDTSPDLLTATVAGHVDIDDDYDKSALKEMKEETGIFVTIGDLQFLDMIRTKLYDTVTGMTNNVLRGVYA